MPSGFPSVFPQQQSLLSDLFQKSFVSRQYIGVFISSGNKECSNGAIHEIGPFLSVSLEKLCLLAYLPLEDIAEPH